MIRPDLFQCQTSPHHIGTPCRCWGKGEDSPNSHPDGLRPLSLRAPLLGGGGRPPASRCSLLGPQLQAPTLALHFPQLEKGLMAPPLHQPPTNRRGRGMLARAWQAPHESSQTCEEFLSSWGWGWEGRNVTWKPSTLSFPLRSPGR